MAKFFKGTSLLRKQWIPYLGVVLWLRGIFLYISTHAVFSPHFSVDNVWVQFDMILGYTFRSFTLLIPRSDRYLRGPLVSVHFALWFGYVWSGNPSQKTWQLWSIFTLKPSQTFITSVLLLPDQFWKGSNFQFRYSMSFLPPSHQRSHDQELWPRPLNLWSQPNKVTTSFWGHMPKYRYTWVRIPLVVGGSEPLLMLSKSLGRYSFHLQSSCSNFFHFGLWLPYPQPVTITTNKKGGTTTSPMKKCRPCGLGWLGLLWWVQSYWCRGTVFNGWME